jgi:CheY-like chemotaxis protein
VELHGGVVEGESAGAGQGSRFTIRLPLEKSAEKQANAPAEPEADGRRRRVLVIEDNEDAARSLQEVLEIGGHDVEVALDGLQGLAKARAFQPEVVLCDIGLPGIDGYEVARTLRADPALPQPLLVALSGYAFQEDVDKSRAVGFDEHLSKPADPAALQRLMERDASSARTPASR